jgi:hypothetical protein
MRKVKEDCISLNSNMLVRSGYGEQRLRWKRGDSIRLWLQDGKAQLLFALRGEEIQQSITMVKAPCHFGGHRHYFLCPGCSNRRYKLIQGGHGFYCRQCYQLPYYSQQCGEADGLARKRHQIESKLMDRAGPKRRTQTTMRLVDQLIRVENKLNEICMRRFGTMIF